MAVTLKMISEQTGFSQTTISRVLNSDPTFIVEEETRRTICETAKRLGYSGGTGRRRRQTKTTEIQIGIATGAAENSQIRTFDQASISAEGSNPNDADSRGQHSGRIEIIENSQIFCA